MELRSVEDKATPQPNWCVNQPSWRMEYTRPAKNINTTKYNALSILTPFRTIVYISVLGRMMLYRKALIPSTSINFDRALICSLFISTDMCGPGTPHWSVSFDNIVTQYCNHRSFPLFRFAPLIKLSFFSACTIFTLRTNYSPAAKCILTSMDAIHFLCQWANWSQ